MDFQGNLPLNYLIEALSSGEMSDNDMVAFRKVLQYTDLKVFQDESLMQQAAETEQAASIRREQLKKEILEKDENLKSIKVKDIKENFSKSQFRSKLRTIQSKVKEMAIESQVYLINPLEIAIKKKNAMVAEMLMKECHLSPLNLSSDLKQSLLEIAALSGISMFETVVKNMKENAQSDSARSLAIIIKVFNNSQQESEEHTETLKSIQNLMISKLLVDLQQLTHSISFETPSDSELKELFQKVISSDRFTDITHAAQFMLIAARQENYELLERLSNMMTPSTYLQYRLLKERAYRNDGLGVRQILTLFPELVHTLRDDRALLRKLSKAIFSTFRDIRDTNVAQMLKEEFSITIIPTIQEESKLLKKGVRDNRFLRLPILKQQELQVAHQQAAFKHVIDIMIESKIKGLSILSEVNAAVDIYLKGKNKHQYIQQLVEKNVLFSTMDIRRDASQETVGQFISETLKSGSLELAITILGQLKDYLERSCSVYPADYFAEVTQYERNYPYREFKIANFIRKCNLKGDSFPVFHGDMDSGDIDDDQEEYLSNIYEDMLACSGELNSSKYPGLPGQSHQMAKASDVFVPNSNAILFKMFASLKAVHLNLAENNIKQVTQILKYSFEFGGFPLVDIGNIKEFPQQAILTKQNRLCSKFSQCINTGKFQTILHQIAYDNECDPQLLVALSSPTSLQRENFNSRDASGKSPVMIAIECHNMNFLQRVRDNKSIFIQDNEQSAQVFQRSIEEGTPQWRISLLSFLENNIRNLSQSHKELLLKSNKKSIHDFIDLVYSSQEEGSALTFLPNSAGAIFTSLNTDNTTFAEYNKQLIESYKLMRTSFQAILEQNDINKSIIFGRMISPSFQLGKLVTKLAAICSLEEIQEIEGRGFQICNIISPGFATKDKSSKMSPLYFPFDNDQFHYCYALKYAITQQPTNRSLVDYIFSKMNLTMWKPFLFEIMIMVGKAYGTNDKLFALLYTQSKAYLMGKLLTVESRLKTFKDSRKPLSVYQYYTESAYKRMLVQFTVLLIQSNEYTYFYQFLEDQSRFYLFNDLIIKGLEASCRHFRPKMAILLQCFSVNENLEYTFSDYSNLMPDLNAKVTLKDVQQTAMIVKSLDKNYSIAHTVKKLSRELLDEFIGHLINFDLLHYIFKFEDKDEMAGTKSLLTDIYHKCSPALIPSLLDYILNQSSEKVHFRVTKLMLELPAHGTYSSVQTNFSKNHIMRRRTEMKQYLLSKIDKFATEPSYYKIILDEKRTTELSEILGVEESDVVEIRKKVKETRDELNIIEDKLFDFNEMQTLIGVFKVQPTKPHRNSVDSISEMKQYPKQRVMYMAKEELKTKSENLILLWEFLKRDERRRKGETFGKINGNGTISDQELRKLIMTSQPHFINLDSLFSGFDTSIVNNDIEEILGNEKFQTIVSKIDLSKYTQAKQLQKLMKSLMPYAGWGEQLKQIPMVLSYYIDLHKAYQQILITSKLYIVKRSDDPEDAGDNDLVNCRGRTQGEITKCLSHLACPIVQVRVMNCVKKYMSVDDIVQLFQITFNDEEEYRTIFGELMSHFLFNPLLYKELRQSFCETLLSKIESDFSFLIQDDVEGSVRDKKFNFYALATFPIFNSTLNDETDIRLKHLILNNAHFMRCMPSMIKQQLFAILASATEGPLNDQMLLMMTQYMSDVNTLEDVRSVTDLFRGGRDTITLKFKAPTDRSNHPMIYLVRSKRFNVLQAYFEIYSEITIEVVMILLQTINPQVPANVDIFIWVLQKAQLDPSVHPTLLQQFLKQTNGATLIKLIDEQFEKGVLLQYQIDVMTNGQEQQSILHDLIQNMNYSAVIAIQELASDTQWEFLKNYGSCYDEGVVQDEGEEQEESMGTKNVIIRPFFKALMQSQFDLCKILMLTENDLKTNLSKAEYQIFQKFLSDARLMGFAKHQKNNNIINKFDEVAYSSNHQLQKLGKGSDEYMSSNIPDFQIAKKILMLPETLLFLHWVPAKFEINLLETAQNKIQKETGFNHEIDAFYISCGLHPTLSKCMAHFQDEYSLYIFEHAFNMRGFLDSKISKKDPNYELLITPHTYLTKAGEIKGKLTISNGEVFRDTQLTQILNITLKEQIDAIKNDMLEEFFRNITTTVQICIASNRFATTFYFLSLQLSYSICESLGFDFQAFRSCQWSLYFGDLSHDLIILQLIHKLFPDESLFKAVIGTNVKDSQATIFYEPASLYQINWPNQPRAIAFLMALFNSQFREQVSFSKYPYDEESKADDKKKNVRIMPEVQDFSNFNQVLQAFLRSTQAFNSLYADGSKQTIELDSLVNMLSIMKEALSIYQKTFGSKELDTLAINLGIPIDCLKPQQLINEDNLLQALIDLANFEEQSYSYYFDLKLTFQNLHGYLQKNPSTLYSKIMHLCDLLSSTVFNYIIALVNNFKCESAQGFTFNAPSKTLLEITFNNDGGSSLASNSQIDDFVTISIHTDLSSDNAAIESSQFVLGIIGQRKIKVVNEEVEDVPVPKVEKKAVVSKKKKKKPIPEWVD